MTINWQKKPSDYCNFNATVLDESRIFDCYKLKNAKKTQKKPPGMENHQKFRQQQKKGNQCTPTVQSYFGAEKFKRTL